MIRSNLAAGVIALNGPEAISAPICNPVNTNEPAPNPTAPNLKQKLPYCCAWEIEKRDENLYFALFRYYKSIYVRGNDEQMSGSTLIKSDKK